MVSSRQKTEDLFIRVREKREEAVFSYDVAPIRLIGSSTSWSVLLEAMTEEKPMAATSFLLGRMLIHSVGCVPKRQVKLFVESKSISPTYIRGVIVALAHTGKAQQHCSSSSKQSSMHDIIAATHASPRLALITRLNVS